MAELIVIQKAVERGVFGCLFIKGKVVRVVPEDEMVDALLEEARRLAEEGAEARMAAADPSARDREQLLEIQGDANQAAARRAAVTQIASPQ